MLFASKGIKNSPYLVSAANILLVFLKPGEVYLVLDHLIRESDELQKNQTDLSRIRWHFTTEKTLYSKMLSTFITSYLETTYYKKRSILLHFKKISFDFSRYVDVSFKTMNFYFLPINVAFDVMMCFLAEGVKIIYRYTYAILKLNKDFIKSIDNEENLLKELRDVSKTIGDGILLKKTAFNYNLKLQHTLFHHAVVKN